MDKHSARGFTLIELMITVAIVGILASIALPAYQRYIARAQASEALVLLEGARLVVDESVNQTGSFPNSLADLEVLGTVTEGEYVSSLTGARIADASGELIATFRSNNLSHDLRNRTVLYTRQLSGMWICSPGGGNPVDPKYLPQSCR